MKTAIILAASLLFLGTPNFIQAQDQLAATAETAVKIVEARRANAKLMHQYSWNSRTELIVDGDVKDMRLEQVKYGPDGQLQRIIENEQGASLPFGFIRRAIAENKRKEMESYLKGLRGLLDQYTLPTAGKVLDFMDKATTILADNGELILMRGSSVVVPGDSLSIWTAASTRKTRKMQVRTFFQDDAVNLTATFNTLRSGLTHVNYAEVIVPGKNLSVQVQNFNYERTMPPPVPPAAQYNQPAASGASSLQTMERKLRDLKDLFEQGLITQSEYDAKKAQVLKGL
jgi:competence protein ComGC